MHPNNLDHNKKDILSDRNVSGRLEHLHLTHFQVVFFANHSYLVSGK